MSENRFRFTDDKIRKIEHDGSTTKAGKLKRIYYWDSQQPGLALQLTPSETKTFKFRHHDKKRGQSINLTIGRHGTFSVGQARKKAAEYLVDLNEGIDVVEKSQGPQTEPTLNELFDQWLTYHAKPHKKSWKNDERRYELYCRKPLGNKRLSWFTSDKIRKWHQNIPNIPKSRGGKTVIKVVNGESKEVPNNTSTTTANRAIALLSTIFNQLGYDNPCKGVKKFREESRDRFLQPTEVKKFFAALHSPETSDILRDYILLSIFTGARRSNILAMKWTNVDLIQEQWVISGAETKNGEPQTIPLVEEALEVLRRRKRGRTSLFVLPGTGKTGHYAEPKNGWKSLLRRAGITNLRLHDLRRTTGSYMSIAGVSEIIVGKTLGHKSSEATKVYTRLNIDPLRDGLTKAAAKLKEYQDQPNKVVNFSSNNREE